MNFLSHYYFDRDVTDCYFILGTVLPDLLKNADKTIVLHPEKLQHQNPHVNAIIKGWNKHLDVDRYFHSSDFFATHSHELKKLLAPVIEGSPVKPFFLGHIAIELILDNLLLTTGKIKVDDFYAHLKGCDNTIIEEFLTSAGLKDTTRFLRFYEGFKRDGYLHTYSETQQIAYALKRICMRVWENPFTPLHEARMNEVLVAYRRLLLPHFMTIFYEIEGKLLAQ
ncbi:ACP phosphodiesterase [Mucilaginibacter sp. UYCu711]|uniref:ACP phosphodiesterase n=1 Tax=Mucilaginibacter sp. UYCu711 TaxID=3156339 RepID=UPI003D1E868F